MNMLVKKYFKELAKKATEEVASAEGASENSPPVVDGPQAPRATAWTALSVHPLQVLETSYVGIVQEAVARAGTDQALSRENEFEALSGFYSLSAADPELLLPDSKPLIDERSRAFKMAMVSVRNLMTSAPNEAYSELTALVENAAELIESLTTINSIKFSSEGIQAAESYLGVFDNGAEAAVDKWKLGHPENSENLPVQVNEVEKRLVEELLLGIEAVASPRCLYNIEAFYLFRLMHRFVGGDAMRPMNLTEKGIASGSVTKAMHPQDWQWLTMWHESQIDILGRHIYDLNAKLIEEFLIEDAPIRFHLKGGRAMNTALGTPEKGTNDWDTGILINPHLSPKQWYEAFAYINDLVISFLDSARFSYTELLNEYEGELENILLVTSEPEDDFSLEDANLFTKAGLLAENEGSDLSEEDAQTSSSAQIRALATGNGANIRKSGVNGELIDIGIATRPSVELREHWKDMRIIQRPGVGGLDIPVPDLAYFIDDFSTIIREAISTSTVDRKLAKRLRRLQLVLSSSDNDLEKAIALCQKRICELLPKTFSNPKLDSSSSAGKLAFWMFDAIMFSVPSHVQRPAWVSSLDDYIVKCSNELFSEKAVLEMWEKLESSFTTEDEKAVMKQLLVVENAASVISREIIADSKLLASVLGAPDNDSAQYWQTVQTLTHAALSVAKPGNQYGFFYLTGGLAAQMQTAHAELGSEQILNLCPEGLVEIVYRANKHKLGDVIKNLLQRLKSQMQKEVSIDLEGDDNEVALVVRTESKIVGCSISVSHATIILIREESPRNKVEIIDFVDGWPIASSRDLAKLFVSRAAHSPDYDVRTSYKKAAMFMRKDVLGRQLLE